MAEIVFLGKHAPTCKKITFSRALGHMVPISGSLAFLVTNSRTLKSYFDPRPTVAFPLVDMVKEPFVVSVHIKFSASVDFH